jgi:rSAM/selenodomain-associated transferase 1
MSSVAVAIMAKWPRAGEVKTRLCPPLALAEAAALYRCFLLDKIDQVRALRGALPVIAYTPDDARGGFEALAPDFTLMPQRGADLGARLLVTLTTLIERGHAGAIAVDSDTPTLPIGFLQQAVDLLADPAVDLVLGPTEDGGYYLIGMRVARPVLFEAIPWSTSRVLALTLERAERAGLKVVCLTPWSDVDTPDDLHRLRALLRGRRDGAPTHTAAYLGMLR